METLEARLIEKMKEYPPYSLNSIISGICVCLSEYLNIWNHPGKVITAEMLKHNFAITKSESNYPEQFPEAFETLCKFIANDDLLQALYSIISSEYNKLDLINTLETLFQGEFLRLLGPENGTPFQINKFCIKLLNPFEGSFCDDTAGIGSTAIDAYSYAKKNGGNLKIHTQEINILCHAASVIRAFIHEVRNCSMCVGNTLTVPGALLSSGSLQTFDYSIMFPPLGLSWKNIADQIYADPYRRFVLGFPPTSSSDWLFVQHQYASLNENGKGIIALSSGALFNSANAKIREEAICAGIIECIITLPPGMLLPYTAIPISLMIINKSKRVNTGILMIQAEGLLTDTQPDRCSWKDASRLDTVMIKRICEIYQNREQIAGVSSTVDFDKFAENDWILLPSRYIHSEIVETEYGNLEIVYPTGGDWTPLRTTGSFYRGINVAPSARSDENGTYMIINLADVQNGEVQINRLTRYELKKNVNVSKYIALPGDVLISCKGSAVKIGVVPPHTEQILLSINFIGIHIDRSRFDPLFIKYYLESPAGQAFLKNKQVGTSIITLTTRDIEEILLPDLPLDRQKQYVQELVEVAFIVNSEIERLYTRSKQAKWSFYQNIGLGKIMNGGKINNDD